MHAAETATEPEVLFDPIFTGLISPYRVQYKLRRATRLITTRRNFRAARLLVVLSSSKLHVICTQKQDGGPKAEVVKT